LPFNDFNGFKLNEVESFDWFANLTVFLKMDLILRVFVKKNPYSIRFLILDGVRLLFVCGKFNLIPQGFWNYRFPISVPLTRCLSMKITLKLDDYYER
jgi:hypothetical protein